MKLENGSIIPGIGIGNIKLGIGKRELLEIIGSDFKNSSWGLGEKIVCEGVVFWITKDGKVDQIGVGKGFKGKYKGLIGIGSTLMEVKEFVGSYRQVYDTYEIIQDKGICFELEDVEDWDELTAPIEYIYVFRV